MTSLLEVPLAAGGSILVETQAAGDQRTMRGGAAADQLMQRGQQTLEEGLGTIAPALGRMLDELRGVSHELSEIEVELGLKLAGEAGMVIARVATEANFRVLVRWQRAAAGEAEA